MSDKLLDFAKLTPGPANLISDLDGIMVGNAEDAAAITGVSVVVPDAPCVAGCAVPGGGPGTRETDALQPANLVERVDAVCLSGGSVYGLDAASAITTELGLQGRGFAMGAPPVVSPIVPAAILFDIGNGGAKDWGDTPPYHRLGKQAFAARAAEFALGNSGAGFGAQAGQLKGGLGSASTMLDDDVCVGALLAVNPVGAVCDAQGTFWAQHLALDHEGAPEFGRADAPGPHAGASHPLAASKLAGLAAGANTTIGVVAVAADLTPAECQRVAIMAQDGLARAIRPVHTPFDGDTIFVLATGNRPLAGEADMRPLALTVLGALAADCVARAIARAVWFADDTGFAAAYRRRFPTAE
ncbi:MAG: P1 family peptidase [Parvibaculales bacterium]